MRLIAKGEWIVEVKDGCNTFKAPLVRCRVCAHSKRQGDALACFARPAIGGFAVEPDGYCDRGRQ